MPNSSPMSIDLFCPRDRGALNFDGSKIWCQTCGREVGQIDEYGIVSLAQKDYFYREVPKDYLNWLVNQDNFLDEFFETAKNDSSVHAVAGYALNESRGAAVLNCPLGEDARVLDLGCGWGNLARSVSRFAKQVVAMDLTYPSLVFASRISRENVVYIHGGDANYLPFADATFDLVILNGVLEWIPDSNREGAPFQAQVDFLKEVHRVLKSNGEVLIGIENRYSIAYILGYKEDHIGLRFVSLLPRRLANVFANALVNKDYRTHTYSQKGLRNLLQQAGFSDTLFYWPWFDYRHPRHVFPMEGGVHLILRGAHSTKARAANVFLRLFAQYPISRLVVPSYYVRAAKGHLKKGFIDRILQLNETDEKSNEALYVTGSNTVVAFGREKAYKIELDSTGEHTIENDYSGAERARVLDGLRPYIPDREMRRQDGHAVLVSPVMQPVTALSESVITEIEHVLRSLSDVPRVTRSFGEMIESEPMWHFLRLTGLQDDWKTILRVLRDQKVELGAVHGDFHLGQVFIFQAQMKIIGWERFALNGIYGSDHWSFALHFWQQTERISWNTLFRERVLENNYKLTRLLPNQGRLISQQGIASRVAFALTIIIDSVARLQHPIWLGREELPQIIARIKLIREFVQKNPEMQI